MRRTVGLVAAAAGLVVILVVALQRPSAGAEAADILTTYAVHDATLITPSGTWHSSPALVDLDGDGDLEIVVAVGEHWMGAWHHDGRPVDGWPQAGGRIVCSPAVSDVDGDGHPEVAISGYLWRSTGAPVAGWPVGVGNCFCTPSLDDVDGDGKLEILSTDLKSGICIYRCDGTLLKGWPIGVPDNDVRCTPLAGDIDGDGKKEIVFTRMEQVYGYHVDGTPLPGFPKRLQGLSQQCIVLADLDGKKRDQLVSGGRAYDLVDGTVTELGGRMGEAPCLCRDPNGRWFTLEPALCRDAAPPPAGIPGEAGWYNDSAVAADIDGDGQVEVLFGNRSGGYHAARQNGTQTPGWPKRLQSGVDCGMAVADLDGDGYLEAVANAGGGRCYVFGCPGPAEGDMPWPLFMSNNLRNGQPDPALRPHPLKRAARPSEKALALEKALASGQWDTAMGVYREALATVDQETKLEPQRVAELKQSGLLSIARILNTRARRFPEAAEAYRQAVAVAPGSWFACQALVECSDLAQMQPGDKQVRDALDASATACLGSLNTLTIPEADLLRYATATALTSLGRPEAAAVTQSLAQTAPPYLRARVQEQNEYSGLPFLLTLQQEQSFHVQAQTKDLIAGADGNGLDSKVLSQLEIDPHSPTLEEFPVHLRLEAGPDLAELLDGNWKRAAGGGFNCQIDKSLPSGDLSTYRCNRITLLSQPWKNDVLTVRREVERVDATHMRVKIQFQTSLPDVEYGFMTQGTGASIDTKSVKPADGAMYCNEHEVRFDTHQRRNEKSPLADGATIEAVVELAQGAKCFYPEVMVRAWGGGEDVAVEPKTATTQVSGTFDGVRYELASDRQFKLRSARTEIFRAFILEKLDAE